MHRVCDVKENKNTVTLELQTWVAAAQKQTAGLPHLGTDILEGGWTDE